MLEKLHLNQVLNNVNFSDDILADYDVILFFPGNRCIKATELGHACRIFFVRG